MTKYQVNWDNGAHACGTFPQVFDTEEEATAFGDEWLLETRQQLEPDDLDEIGYEVIEVEPEPTEEEMEEACQMDTLRKAALSRGQP